MPATVIALPLYFLLNASGLTGSYWSVLLPSMVSPFGVYLARIHANASVPDEIIEAARIDGAGDLRIFGIHRDEDDDARRSSRSSSSSS